MTAVQIRVNTKKPYIGRNDLVVLVRTEFCKSGIRVV